MHTTFLTLTALIAAVTNAQITAAPSVSVPLVSGCPAIVLVTLLCNTCVTLDCIETAVVTAGCRGCPSTAATVRTGYPCDQGCAGLGGCKTVYNIVSAQDPGECEAVTIGTGTETAGSGSATEGSSSTTSTSEVPTIGSIIPDETTTTTEISGSATQTTGSGNSESVPTQTTPSGTGSADSTSSTAPPASTNAAGRLRPWRLW